jgi:hypothetical protein
MDAGHRVAPPLQPTPQAQKSQCLARQLTAHSLHSTSQTNRRAPPCHAASLPPPLSASSTSAHTTRTRHHNTLPVSKRTAGSTHSTSTRTLVASCAALRTAASWVCAKFCNVHVTWCCVDPRKLANDCFPRQDRALCHPNQSTRRYPLGQPVTSVSIQRQASQSRSN